LREIVSAKGQSTSTDNSRDIEVADVVVSVGTDHHPFDRLISWMDEWRNRHPDVTVVIQRGTSQPSRIGGCHRLIPHGELCDLFARASAVVSHAGPSTVMDARMAGRLPIVVARDPDFGEHVDGHQMRFARHLQHHEIAVVVEAKHELFTAIDRALARPGDFTVNVGTRAADGVHRFGSVVDELLGTSTPIVPNSPASAH
jgi:UDP-N-acetylglucosamine transferase subunit ALG13